MKDVVAIYPGSFDPLTNGHVDIIQRGSRLFDRIVIALLVNLEKAPLFTVPERVDLAREVFRGWANVEVDTFAALLVDYARRKDARGIVWGGGAARSRRMWCAGAGARGGSPPAAPSWPPPPAARTPASSSGACAPCRTSSTSCRWR